MSMQDGHGALGCLHFPQELPSSAEMSVPVLRLSP